MAVMYDVTVVWFVVPPPQSVDITSVVPLPATTVHVGAVVFVAILTITGFVVVSSTFLSDKNF